MKKQHFSLRIVLALFLLFAQQAAMSHAFSHFASIEQTAKSEKSLLTEKACEQCFAFAQLGSSHLNTDSAAIAAPIQHQHWSAATLLTFYPLFSSAFHARAPPALSPYA